MNIIKSVKLITPKGITMKKLLLSVLSLCGVLQASEEAYKADVAQLPNMQQVYKESSCPSFVQPSHIVSGTYKAGMWLTDRAGCVKPGHVAAGALVVGTCAATGIAYKIHPSLAFVPPVVATWMFIKSKIKNDIYDQDASKQHDHNITDCIGVQFPLAYINTFVGCPSDPCSIKKYYSSDQENSVKDAKIKALWSELAAKTGIHIVDDYTYRDVKKSFEDTIAFINVELNDLRNHTDIETQLVFKVLEARGEVDNGGIDEYYLRHTDVLLEEKFSTLADKKVFDALDTWCAELQEKHWADKLFKIRFHLTKWFGKIGYYPYWSSITYNGASRYAVELLKQLARLKAIKMVLDTNLKHANTRVIQNV